MTTFAALKNETMMQKEWFEEWFDSPYYHILYKHRDEEEAALFLDRIIALLQIPPNSKVLDLACGRGRHAIHLNKSGLDVIGLDLSEKSIAHANVMSNDKLHFYVHDMRNIFRNHYFDYIFNLFTSFGYFEHDSDDVRVLQNVSNSLKSGGYFIFDFLNVGIVKFFGEVKEKKVEDNIEFTITKKEMDGKIIKTIEFNHMGMDFSFDEKVKMIDFDTIKNYFSKTELTIKYVYGNYNLDNFDENKSDRLIIIAQKN